MIRRHVIGWLTFFASGTGMATIGYINHTFEAHPFIYHDEPIIIDYQNDLNIEECIISNNLIQTNSNYQCKNKDKLDEDNYIDNSLDTSSATNVNSKFLDSLEKLQTLRTTYISHYTQLNKIAKNNNWKFTIQTANNEELDAWIDNKNYLVYAKNNQQHKFNINHNKANPNSNSLALISHIEYIPQKDKQDCGKISFANNTTLTIWTKKGNLKKYLNELKEKSDNIFKISHNVYKNTDMLMY